MTLQDHFHPPLSARRHWHAFHNSWATYISAALNQQLPAGYFAEPNVQFGIEIDVAAFDETPVAPFHEGATSSLLTASRKGWAPPAPRLTIPFPMVTEIVEVAVFFSAGGPTLAGAIELVSPANKDRPAQREAFVSKCQAYLQQGVGLAIVDVVTERRGNLHAELLARFPTADLSQPDTDLYAAAYRPVDRGGQPNLDIWLESLAVGRSLPNLPLWLRGGICFRIDLDTTYDRTCQEQRVTVNGA